MVVGVTDFLDGYVARRLHQVSTLGKVLDPTADRLVLVTGVIAIAVYGAVPGWLAGVVLGRELLVSVAVLVLAALGREAHRRALGRQGGHVRPHVLLPALPAGRRARDLGSRAAPTSPGWRVVPALDPQLRRRGGLRPARPASARRARAGSGPAAA